MTPDTYSDTGNPIEAAQASVAAAQEAFENGVNAPEEAYTENTYEREDSTFSADQIPTLHSYPAEKPQQPQSPETDPVEISSSNVLVVNFGHKIATDLEEKREMLNAA